MRRGYGTALMLLLLAVSALGAVDGTVTNRTREKPQPGAVVQLYQIGAAGPQFVAATKSDAQGHFRIDRDLPPGPHLLMTSYAGVNYNKMIPPGQPSTGLDVAVFESSSKPGPVKVAGHTMVLEPSPGQVGVTESFFFSNPGKVTWHDPDRGTLRFEVPKGVESPRARVTEPGGMPIEREPDKTKTAGLFTLDYPIKPGETEFDVMYTAPLAASGEFSAKVLYPTATRFAVPSGVTLEADGLKPLGQEPRSQANLYEIAGQRFRLKLTGTGSLQQAAAGPSADDSGPRMSVIVPPGFDNQRTKILVLALVVLALGFALLYRKGRTA